MKQCQNIRGRDVQNYARSQNLNINRKSRIEKSRGITTPAFILYAISDKPQARQ